MLLSSMINGLVHTSNSIFQSTKVALGAETSSGGSPKLTCTCNIKDFVVPQSILTLSCIQYFHSCSHENSNKKNIALVVGAYYKYKH